MKKAWSIIIVIVLVAILLGAVSVGVGFLTGADMERIMTTIEARYNIDFSELIGVWIPNLFNEVFSALTGPQDVSVVSMTVAG